MPFPQPTESLKLKQVGRIYFPFPPARPASGDRPAAARKAAAGPRRADRGDAKQQGQQQQQPQQPPQNQVPNTQRKGWCLNPSNPPGQNRLVHPISLQ